MHRAPSRRIPWLWLGPAVWLAGGCAPAPPEPRPNLVLITVESLRADHLGAYGYARATSPQLDALARQATVFENAFAVTSWTLPAHASIFTGLDPSAHQVRGPRDRLGDGYETLAERLSDCGYQTAAVVSGSYLTREHGLARGFAHHDATAVTPPGVDAGLDVTNPRVATAVERFLGEVRRPDGPFFLFVYYWDPHYHYLPPPPYDALFVPEHAAPVASDALRFTPDFRLGRDITPRGLAWVVAQYDGEIRATDAELGALFARLRALGLWERTTVVVTSDHGEQFFEHGRLGHKHDLHVESLHVPLLVRQAGQTRGRRDPRLVRQVDLFPTLLELAGCGVPEGQQGRSLLAPPPDPLRPSFFELREVWFRQQGLERSVETEDWYAVRRGDTKLVRRESDGREALYDLARDPRELAPLAGRDAERAALRAELERWRARMAERAADHGASEPSQLSPAQEERLRSLGYVQ